MRQVFIITSIFTCTIALCSKWNLDDYGTHQPVLYAMATITSGPIIEFGCGNSSTDLLHEICKKNNRILISVDDNLEWLNKFKQKYIGDGYELDNSGWHKFYYVPGKKDHLNPDHWIEFFNDFALLNTIDFDVCFIDQSPWLARYETIKRLGSKARYIILHDCDFFPVYNIFGKTIRPTCYKTQTEGIFDYSDVFTYFKIYYPPKPWPGFSGPPTLLASNVESDFPEIDFVSY